MELIVIDTEMTVQGQFRVSCFYDQMCHYAYWFYKLEKPDGKVFRHIGSDWIAEMRFKNKAGEVNNFILRGSDHISVEPKMTATIAQNSKLTGLKDVILVEDNVYSVTASDRNRPVSGQIGDIQIMSQSYYIGSLTSVRCMSGACKVSCITDEPSIKRLDPRETIKDP